MFPAFIFIFGGKYSKYTYYKLTINDTKPSGFSGGFFFMPIFASFLRHKRPRQNPDPAIIRRRR